MDMHDGPFPQPQQQKQLWEAQDSNSDNEPPSLEDLLREYHEDADKPPLLERQQEQQQPGAVPQQQQPPATVTAGSANPRIFDTFDGALSNLQGHVAFVRTDAPPFAAPRLAKLMQQGAANNPSRCNGVSGGRAIVEQGCVPLDHPDVQHFHRILDHLVEDPRVQLTLAARLGLWISAYGKGWYLDLHCHGGQNESSKAACGAGSPGARREGATGKVVVQCCGRVGDGEIAWGEGRKPACAVTLPHGTVYFMDRVAEGEIACRRHAYKGEPTMNAVYKHGVTCVQREAATIISEVEVVADSREDGVQIVAALAAAAADLIGGSGGCSGSGGAPNSLPVRLVQPYDFHRPLPWDHPGSALQLEEWCVDPKSWSLLSWYRSAGVGPQLVWDLFAAIGDGRRPWMTLHPGVLSIAYSQWLLHGTSSEAEAARKRAKRRPGAIEAHHAQVTEQHVAVVLDRAAQHVASLRLSSEEKIREQAMYPVRLEFHRCVQPLLLLLDAGRGNAAARAEIRGLCAGEHERAYDAVMYGPLWKPDRGLLNLIDAHKELTPYQWWLERQRVAIAVAAACPADVQAACAALGPRVSGRRGGKIGGKIGGAECVRRGDAGETNFTDPAIQEQYLQNRAAGRPNPGFAAMGKIGGAECVRRGDAGETNFTDPAIQEQYLQNRAAGRPNPGFAAMGRLSMANKVPCFARCSPRATDVCGKSKVGKCGLCKKHCRSVICPTHGRGNRGHYQQQPSHAFTPATVGAGWLPLLWPAAPAAGVGAGWLPLLLPAAQAAGVGAGWPPLLLPAAQAAGQSSQTPPIAAPAANTPFGTHGAAASLAGMLLDPAMGINPAAAQPSNKRRRRA